MKTVDWDFPLPRTHTGVPLGNGLLGALVWGEGRVLRITLARGDLWDHRGGMEWTEEQNYARIRTLLEKSDAQGLFSLFSSASGEELGTPKRPSVIPLGRMDLDFGKGVELSRGTLSLKTGTVSIIAKKGGKKRVLTLAMDMDAPALLMNLPRDLQGVRLKRVPSWEYIGEELETVGFKPPKLFSGKSGSGWVQTLPVDDGACVMWRQSKGRLLVAVERGATARKCRRASKERLDHLEKEGAPKMLRRIRAWWKQYWRDVPSVRVPNATLQELHDLGMYKFAGLTNPSGAPAGLQGSWLEEYRLPPWSNDFHFNINVQMIYDPAYRGNRLEHLRPLFDMVWSWRETLSANARAFLGIDDGYMLPHAVDDQCRCMGGFWSGSVDHGCTAWVAAMMYRYYKYTLDERFLRTVAYPFMVGAMRVYEEMMEKTSQGYSLPVSVSPEYRGSGLNAWGANASFQLACAHRLCEDLLDASAVLNEQPSAAWKDISNNLPRATLTDSSEKARIALWEGTCLEQSHRHHSHLAGITPFDTIDIDDPTWRPIVFNSLNEWVERGMGRWSGWCVPWASMINTRMGNGGMAELQLEIVSRVFFNEGRGSLHNAEFPGYTLIGNRYERLDEDERPPDLMQADAAMGAVSAVQEMLLHTRRGVNYVMRGCPERWKNVRFDGMRTEGAFLFGATRKRGVLQTVRIRSLAGGTVRLANPWGGAVELIRKDIGVTPLEGEILSIPMKKGERLVLEPA